MVAFGAPVPQADPKALAWMTAEQNAPRPKESLIHRGTGLLPNGPDVHMSAQNGTPNMEPESDTLSGSDVLSPGNRATTGTSSIVGVVPVGQTPAAGSSPEDVNASQASETPASTNVPTEPAAATPADSGTGTAATTATDGSTTAPADTAKTDAPATTTTDGAKTDAPATATDSSTTPAADGTQPATDTTNQKESSSKKKGLKKLIPW